MKKLLITILILACGIIIGLVAYDTYLGITEDFPDGFVDKYKNCPKCDEPTLKIEGGKIYPDNQHYLDTIKALSSDIADLKASNKDLQTELKCFKDSYVSWESYKCD